MLICASKCTTGHADKQIETDEMLKDRDSWTELMMIKECCTAFP